MTDDFDATLKAELDGLSDKRLRELRILTKNEITFLRGEMANGGPDRTDHIAVEQKRLHGIESKLEPP